PAPLAAVLVRAAALSPEQRHGDALGLLADLEKAAQADTVRPEPALAVETPAAAIMMNEAPALLPMPGAKRVRRVALTSLVGAGVVALLLRMFISSSTEELAPKVMPDTLASKSTPAATTAPASGGQDMEASPPSPPSAPPPRPVEATRGAPTRVKPSSPRGSASASRGDSRPAQSGTSQPQGPQEPPATTPVGANAARSATPGRGELRVVTVHKGKAVWANVSVDGKHHGATPVSLDLPEGRHSVRVERDGFVAQQRVVDVSPETRAVVRIELHE
ncbi:PEGA domain-containing protein, partial [Pyxidicoccus sp. 3LG]